MVGGQTNNEGRKREQIEDAGRSLSKRKHRETCLSIVWGIEETWDRRKKNERGGNNARHGGSL